MSDFRRIIIHTNFTNSISRTYEIGIDDLLTGDLVPGIRLTALELLRACFFYPETLDPKLTPEELTKDAAMQVARLAKVLRAERDRDAPLTRLPDNARWPTRMSKFRVF